MKLWNLFKTLRERRRVAKAEAQLASIRQYSNEFANMREYIEETRGIEYNTCHKHVIENNTILPVSNTEDNK